MSASAASTLYVQNLYSTILLRSGSAGDVNSWATLLDSGLLTQQQELTAFETSPEAVNFVDPAVRMYQTFFGRAPDPAGLDGWVNDLRNGTITMQGLAEGFSHSTEFTNRYGSNPNASAFVTALYANVLGRAPDAQGLAGWVGFLTAGTLDFAQVALGFSNSTEFINNSNGAINNWLTAADVTANAGGVVSPPGSAVYPDQGIAIPGIIPNNTTTQNYVLTTGLDNATATNFFASLTVFNVDGHGPTLNPGDSLTGLGSNATLTVTDLTAGAAFDNIPAGVTLNNIANVVLNSSGNTAASGFNTTAVPGVKTLSVTTAGAFGDFVAATNGASGTTITVDHTSFAGGGVVVLGGTTVAVTENSPGNVLVGLVGVGSVPSAPNVATADVTVTTNSTGAGNVNIVGGTSVTVNAPSTSYFGSIDVGNTPNNTGDSSSGGLANPTGTISVTIASGGENGAINVFGGSTVNVVAAGGDNVINVGDPAAILASNEATGAITVTDMAANLFDGQQGSGHNAVVAGAITVDGGTTVNITSNGGGAIIVGAPGNGAAKAALPTGAITVSDIGVDLFGNAPITIDGGTNVSASAVGSSITVGGAPAFGKVGIDPSGTIGITELFGTLYTNHQAIKADGGTTVTVTSLGQNVTIGANQGPTGVVTVSQSGVLTGAGAGAGFGAVAVSGGTTVGVTTTGGSVTVGSATGLPSGAVTITDTFSGANGANTDAFAVTGGTTVSLTTTATGGAVSVGAAPVLNATGTGLLNAAQEPTGNVTVADGSLATAFGVGATNAYTNGATTASITGGTFGANNTVNTTVDGFVMDAEATVATGGASAGKAVGTSTLATVTLDGVTDATGDLPGIGGTHPGIQVVSDALATVSDFDTQATASEVFVTDHTAGHTLAFVVGNVGKGGLTVADASAKSLNISDNGKANATTGTNLLTVAGAAATSVSFANSASMNAVLSAVNLGALTTINDTGSGNLVLGSAIVLGAASGAITGAVTAINAGGATGGVTVEVFPANTSFAGGSGTDVVSIDSNTTMSKSGSINGGTSGHNTIFANYAAAIGDVALGSNSAITGFTTYGFGPAATSGGGVNAYDVTGFSSLAVGAGGTLGDLLITNASNGGTLTVAGYAAVGGNIVYDLHSYGSSNSMTLTIGTDGPVGIGSSSPTVTLVATKMENVTVTSQGAIIPGVNVNTVHLWDTLASSLTVTGDQALTTTLATDGGGALASSGSSLSVINASAATGPVNLAGVQVSAAGVTATGGAGLLTVNGALGAGGIISGADGPSTAQVDTVNIATDAAGDTIAVTVNGITAKYTPTTGVAATDATNIATLLTGTKGLGGFTFAGVGSTVTITDTTKGQLFFSSVSVSSKAGGTTASDATTTAFVNGSLSAAVDSITTGSGGGNITIGTGGSWNAGLKAYDSGSETINLIASANAVDKLVVIDGATATFNGVKGGATGFVVSPSLATADQFDFSSAAKTVLANNSTSTSVGSTTDSVKHYANILLGAAGDATLANLTWTSSNGVITFGATGGHSVGEFTSGQLVAAAEVILDNQAAPTNDVAAFVSAGSTYVVSSGATGKVTTAVNDNSVVELIGVSGITGFGTTAGQGTIVDSTAANLTLQIANGGTGNLGTLKGGTFDDTGFAADIFTTGATGITNTFNNLEPSATLTINSGTKVGGIDLGNLVTSQTGAAGANTLTLQFTNAGGPDSLDSATVAGDNTLILVAAGVGSSTITSLVDPGNTLAALVVGFGGATIGSVTDGGLLVVTEASTDNTAVSLGGLVPLSQSGLSITLNNGANTINATGGADHITSGTGASTINAVGSADVISVAQVGGGGANTITANGAGDTINIGNGAGNTVTATGVGDVVNEQTIGGVGSSGGNTFNLGSNAVLILTSAAVADTIHLTGDVAGTSASFGFTTIKGAIAGDHIVLANTGTEGWLGDLSTGGVISTLNVGATGVAGSEVNVASSATLSAAVNLAASQAATKAAAAGGLPGASGVADWFQFGGNTYIVEATNSTGAPAAHSGLAAGDYVVELVGLFTPTGGLTGGHILTL